MCQCGDNVKVSLLVWHTLTHFAMQSTRFALALQVQRWTRARSECLQGGGKNYSYATVWWSPYLLQLLSPFAIKRYLVFLTFYRALPYIFGVFSPVIWCSGWCHSKKVKGEGAPIVSTAAEMDHATPGYSALLISISLVFHRQFVCTRRYGW